MCKITNCTGLLRARGYCNSHYLRLKRYGDPEGIPTRDTPEQRFWAKVDKGGDDDCWNWSANKTKGYGSMHYSGRPVLAHRFSYSLHNGEIPSGVQIDHKCHNPSCVNPKHLRPLTPRQNTEHRKGANKNSITGIRGVSWDKRASKYLAQVSRSINGKPENVFFKHFTDIVAAEKAVVAARLFWQTHNDVDKQHA